MLLKKLIQTRTADAELPSEIRAAGRVAICADRLTGRRRCRLLDRWGCRCAADRRSLDHGQFNRDLRDRNAAGRVGRFLQKI